MSLATTPSGWATFEALYDSQLDRVYGYLVVRTGSRQVAEDLAAETFIAAARQWTDGKATEVTPAWLTMVAKRRLVDHWRSREAQRRRLTRLNSERLTRVAATDPVDIMLSDDMVLDALGDLSDRQRQALVMRYLDDLSVGEVADSMAISYQATESLLARARRAFAAAYAHKQIEQDQ